MLIFDYLHKKLAKFIYYTVLGDSVKDKLYVFIFYLLWSTGLNFAEKVCRKIVGRIVIRVSGVKYRLVDPESFFIVAPRYEAPIWNYFKLGKGDIFIDVGAHIGKYTLQVAKTVGDKGLVVAIEPDPENYRVLTENITLNNLRNVIALNMAAWNNNCRLKLYRGYGSPLHSVKFRSDNFVHVLAKRLDDVLEELDIKHVEWIKIDVEGAEYEV